MNCDFTVLRVEAAASTWLNVWCLRQERSLRTDQTWTRPDQDQAVERLLRIASPASLHFCTRIPVWLSWTRLFISSISTAPCLLLVNCMGRMSSAWDSQNSDAAMWIDSGAHLLTLRSAVHSPHCYDPGELSFFKCECVCVAGDQTWTGQLVRSRLCGSILVSLLLMFVGAENVGYFRSGDARTQDPGFLLEIQRLNELAVRTNDALWNTPQAVRALSSALLWHFSNLNLSCSSKHRLTMSMWFPYRPIS